MLAPKPVKYIKRKEHYRTNSSILNQFNTVFKCFESQPMIFPSAKFGESLTLLRLKRSLVALHLSHQLPYCGICLLQSLSSNLYISVFLFSLCPHLGFLHLGRFLSALLSCLQPWKCGCFTFSEDPDCLKCSFSHLSFLTLSLSQLKFWSISHGFLSALLTCLQSKSPDFLG